MENEYKDVPVLSAKKIAKDYDKDEVIILSIDRTFNKVHLTTYGKDKAACKRAEITSEFLAELLQIKHPVLFLDLIEELKKRYFEQNNKTVCTCPTECDCQQPPTHISNECPVHNENPYPADDCPVHNG